MSEINNIHKYIDELNDELKEMKTYFNSFNDDDLEKMIDDNSLEDIIKDFSIDEEIRILALQKYSIDNNEDVTAELLNTLGSVYLFAGTSMLENFLYMIIVISNVNVIFKIQCIDLLISYMKNSDNIEDNIVDNKYDFTEDTNENLHTSRVVQSEIEEKRFRCSKPKFRRKHPSNPKIRKTKKQNMFFSKHYMSKF